MEHENMMGGMAALNLEGGCKQAGNMAEVSKILHANSCFELD